LHSDRDLPKGDTVTIAVIGATGRVGSEIVRGVLARGDAVAALVRDPGKARRTFGEPDGLHIRPTRLDDPRDLIEAFDGIRTVFIAMGSIGIEGVVQRIAINAAAGISSIEQVTRLSVLNASADSLGINQRAHDSIDQFASSTAVPYSTIRQRSSRRRCSRRCARCAPRAPGPASPTAAVWP
jgi:NAD(P)H dehydrogenase (quinone)